MHLSRSLQAADFSILCGRCRTGNRPAFPRFVTDVAETDARMVQGNQDESKSWEEIAAQASTEHDAERVVKLLRELCERLDQARSPSNRVRISQIYAQTVSPGGLRRPRRHCRLNYSSACIAHTVFPSVV